MPSGGARNRSGPPKDPRSRTSERAGLVLTALPMEGRRGRAPAFPLPKVSRSVIVITGDGKRVEPDRKVTDSFRRRELEIWREHWKMPQACAWEREPWRWHTIGEFCRLKAVIELEPDANAALVAQLHRYRDQIGLTNAGMKECGWAIARDEVGAKAAERAAEPAAKSAPSRRLRGVPADAQ